MSNERRVFDLSMNLAEPQDLRPPDSPLHTEHRQPLSEDNRNVLMVRIQADIEWFRQEVRAAFVEALRSAIIHGSSFVVIDGDHVDGPVVQVELDECWKCRAEIPKDDDFGLCQPCKTAMQEFTDTPTPVAPTYEREWGNDLGVLPTDHVREAYPRGRYVRDIYS